jgi:hypothetical protein
MVVAVNEALFLVQDGNFAAVEPPAVCRGMRYSSAPHLAQPCHAPCGQRRKVDLRTGNE